MRGAAAEATFGTGHLDVFFWAHLQGACKLSQAAQG